MTRRLIDTVVAAGEYEIALAIRLLLAPQLDHSAVVGRDVFDDGQTQAGAAGHPGAGLIDAEKPFEDALLIVGGDADTAVGDRDGHHRASVDAGDAPADRHRGGRG